MGRDDLKKSRKRQKTEVSGDHSVGAGDVEKSLLVTGGVGGDLNIYNEPPIKNSSAASPLPRQLPSDLADFKGRDREVNDLTKALAQGEGRVAISAIGGLGGVGKSVLAVRVAHLLVDRYPDGQIVVDMQGTSDRPLTAIEAMARVIQAFHPEARVSDDLEQVARDYRNTLTGKQTLILLDNAANASQVRSLMPSPPCAVIITSRRSIVLPGLRPINLDALSEQDASELLSSIAGAGRATEEQRNAIAELCGRLPLALRVAGTFLAVHRDWTVAEYIETLSDERQRLAHLKQDDLDVEATLALSAKQLESERSDLAARWKTLAVFPADFDRAAAAAVLSITIEEARDSLSALLERSLVIYDEESVRYHLHDLVRLFTACQLSESECARSQQLHASHYKTVLGNADDLYLQGGDAIKQGLAMFDLEWRNIQAGQAWATSQAEKDEAAAELCSNYSIVGTHTLSLRLYPRNRISWLEPALAAARRLNNRANEGKHLDKLGLAYTALSEPRRAIEYHKQCLAIACEIKDRRAEGSALGNLGVAYADLGNTHCAIEHHNRALIIEREIGDRRAEGRVLGNLGNAYAALKETHRAIDYYKQYLAIAREIGDRRGESGALGNLGVAYKNLDDIHRAIEHYEQQLTITREIRDRRGEGNALGNLGLAYDKLDNTHRAIEYYKQRMAIAREIGDRRGEGNALVNMSVALYKLGDCAQAILNAEAALKIYEQIESPYADETRKLLAEWREPK